MASRGLLPPSRPHFLHGYLRTGLSTQLHLSLAPAYLVFVPGTTASLQLELLNPTRLDGRLVVVVVHCEHVWCWSASSYFIIICRKEKRSENV